jgi:hypothetical protein
MEQEITRQFAEFQAVHQELDRDFLTYMLRTADDDSQLWKRAVARSLFAHVEAVTFHLKRLAYHSHRVLGIVLTTEELAALEELEFQIDDTGEVNRHIKRIPALRNLRFAFKVFSKVHQLDWSPDFGGKGWDSFKKALKIRDRITHPRTQADISIAVDDFEAIKAAQVWWRNTLNDLFFKDGSRFSTTKQPSTKPP